MTGLGAYANLIKYALIIAVIIGIPYYFYNKGVEVTEQQYEIMFLKAKEEADKKLIAAQKQSVKVVTVYKDRIITQKQIEIKYVDKIREQISNSDSFPANFIGLYNSQIQDSERNAGTTGNVDVEAPKP